METYELLNNIDIFTETTGPSVQVFQAHEVTNSELQISECS